MLHFLDLRVRIYSGRSCIHDRLVIRDSFSNELIHHRGNLRADALINRSTG
ncbi:hypothetical protein D3C74_287180 [compost metagenome]